MKWHDFIIEIILNYFSKAWSKISENFLPNLISLIVGFFIIFAMAQTILNFGILTLVSYIIACIYGLIRIVDDPRLPIIWGVGFAICAVAVDIIFTSFIPVIKSKDAVSALAGIVILYIVISLYSKGQELKNA